MGNSSLSCNVQTSTLFCTVVYHTVHYRFLNTLGDSVFVTLGGGLGARGSDEPGRTNSAGLPG